MNFFLQKTTSHTPIQVLSDMSVAVTSLYIVAVPWSKDKKSTCAVKSLLKYRIINAISTDSPLYRTRGHLCRFFTALYLLTAIN